MAIKYQVKLDGNVTESPIFGLSELVLGISRESGIDNKEQILRDEIESQFTFSGEEYKYIANKRKQNACSQITLQIDALCSGQQPKKLATGILKQSKIDLFIRKNIAKTNKSRTRNK